MSSLQTRTNGVKINFGTYVLKRPTIRGGYCYHFEIPIQYQDQYKNAITNNGGFYTDLTDFFHQQCSSPPYTADQFMKFFKEQWGFGYEIKSFENPTERDLKGGWGWDDEKENVIIYVLEALPYSARKTTTIHECFHVIQELDPGFTEMLLDYPPEIHRAITERITNKTMVEVVLPKKEYDSCKRKGMTNAQIADTYAVSIELVKNFGG